MVMEAANRLDIYVPHFCYHKKLSIAANCRMCLVEVEKAPKPLPACATPVTPGMIVRTQSDRAKQAQKSVMEFLLINHPLDCPICDQGGECQLQDLAVGYGGSTSRYDEPKRVVFHKSMGPLISAEEMTRCIHCTRCVRFGQEIAGLMELGMAGRGEHSEIMSFVGRGVDSELSGNMIDLCPVGALTSKPFRYEARPWELSRRKSISPHDSRRREPHRPGEEPARDARPAAGERGRQRAVAVGPRPLLVRGPARRRAPAAADDQAGRPVARGRLERRARVRRARAVAREGRARGRGHRRAGGAAQHAGRTAPAGEAGARAGLGQHRLPAAPERLHAGRPARRRAVARHEDRRPQHARPRAARRFVPAQGPAAAVGPPAPRDEARLRS